MTRQPGNYILIAGGSGEKSAEIERVLRAARNLPSRNIAIYNGNTQALFSEAKVNDIVVYCMTEPRSDIETLKAKKRYLGVPLIIISPHEDTRLMRYAMTLGARDFLVEPHWHDELVGAIHRIGLESQSSENDVGKMISLINVKGGSGSTMLACNLAYMIRSISDESTSIIDFDLQFPSVGLYFDLIAQYRLADILDSLATIDSLALDAFMAKHPKNGLRVMTFCHDEIVLPGDIAREKIDVLIGLLRHNYRNVFVDLPRQIDPLTGSFLEQSDVIIVIMQPSIMHLHNAKRLFSILTTQLDVPRKRIVLAINRFDSKHAIATKDIDKHLGIEKVVKIPDDYQTIIAAVNLGASLIDYAPKRPVTRCLEQLASSFTDQAKIQVPNLFQRLLGSRLG